MDRLSYGNSKGLFFYLRLSQSSLKWTGSPTNFWRAKRLNKSRSQSSLKWTGSPTNSLPMRHLLFCVAVLTKMDRLSYNINSNTTAKDLVAVLTKMDRLSYPWLSYQLKISNLQFEKFKNHTFYFYFNMFLAVFCFHKWHKKIQIC